MPWTALMRDDEKVTFLVMVTVERPTRWSRPCFVRAGSLAEAYVEIIERDFAMFQVPNVHLEGFVIGAGENPDAKRIAKAWWALARQSDEDGFEDLWNEHGALPQEDE